MSRALEGARDFLGVVIVALGWTVVECVIEENFEKQKTQLSETIRQDLNFNSVELKNFDWYVTDDEEYLLKFTGSATNSMDEKVDFFACSYEVSETQFKEIEDFVSKKNKKDMQELDSAGLLKRLNSIIKEAELVSSKELPVVATETEDNNMILNVSKAKVNGDKVSYYVSYATAVKDAEGNLSLKKTLAEVSYDLTDDLAMNPNGVFLMSKDNAKFKVVDVKEKKLDVFQLETFNEANQNRRKL
jgi:hypothetical protein